MKTLIGLLPLVLHGTAALACFGLVWLGADGLFLLLTIPTYPVCLVLAAGIVGGRAAGSIQGGRFVRDPASRLYRGRMVYGTAWTAIYYCKPVLHLLLSCPPCKALVFRMFGYRGSLDFTIYPDCWIRDLRLLDFGPGTYIANRVTLGTNHVRSDGKIQVAGIKTGRDVIVGHLAMVGGGTRIGDESEVGVGAKVGFKVRIGRGVSLGPDCLVDSGSRVMDGVVIGTRAHIGKACVIHPGLRIPAGAMIPDRSVIRCEADLDRTRERRRAA